MLTCLLRILKGSEIEVKKINYLETCLVHVCVDINILFTVLEEYEFNEASSREDTCIVEEKGRICIFCILASIHLFFFRITSFKHKS